MMQSARMLLAPSLSEPESIERAGLWFARTAIDVAARGIGIGTLPISIPIVGAVSALRASGRVVADNILEGTVPVFGPPVARTLDRLLAA